MSAARPILLRLTCRMLAVLLVVAAPNAHAADEMVTLNFVNADIEAVAAAMGQMVNRNFVIDPRVKGTVNIISSRPVPVPVAYEIFLSALRMQGFAAVEGGGVVKILPEADAKLHLRGVAPPASASGDRLVTQVFVLRHESAAQLVPVLRPLISPNNTIAVYPNNNSLVITDYADNLRRIERIIDSIDRPVGGDPVIMPLRHASASDVAQTVSRILADAPSGAAGQGAVEARQRVVVAPDSRTNSVIVRSEDPTRLARVQAMVQQLDVPTGAVGNIHVVYLKNADAVKVAQTLRAILSGDSIAASQGAPSPTGAVPPLPSSGGPSASTGMVQADVAANAIIISAPEPVVASLKAVIEKLDIRRAQVFVEALIVEVTAEKAAEFGVQWQAINPISGNTQGFGATNFGARGTGTNIIDLSSNLAAAAPGLNVGVVRGTITLPGVGTITNLAVLARALESDTKANILSTPNLLTLTNEEAKIVVGQNVPFITGQYAQTGSSTTATPFQTIERRDVGLTLRIRPQISEGGSVKLQIYQEVSSVQDTTNAAGVITNKRSIESMVVVEDGEIVALGGLVQDSTGSTSEKVPGFGDLPLIGWLFRYETRKQTKTNLMVFLRPVVVRDGATSGSIAATRYRQMQQEQEKSQMPSSVVLPNIEAPKLPPSDFPGNP